ncbi:Reverse transcriptase domain and Integrase, catalytic core domain and Zinc finger, CCHC-type domain and Ribonuclease H-like domain and Aspartic peptidase domain-containing protein [Strongyloides ratti]|uniref:RNA-directed DNA polymerase n=1 Tax=Strongyloides ratti TaxID=34506 RepID=A0A090LNS3_STRRB|nr:Reverse transcriptase domain and Integrase, catalytic core domain and Zinc finger, CCHC-type domain and Ribonuclease H-like domain and Aspartic peptidase domain-containing protein [Strongyloides ratti]CEF69824.1 Reverse transcriptase domain and Integrase, catalytic core domain and Zinc finger, CCHC-type domain and Ribonuclease H-like domain and Aspartic peptidase domain-containing protein [Strongyloides ratti]
MKNTRKNTQIDDEDTLEETYQRIIAENRRESSRMSNLREDEMEINSRSNTELPLEEIANTDATSQFNTNYDEIRKENDERLSRLENQLEMVIAQLSNLTDYHKNTLNKDKEKSNESLNIMNRKIEKRNNSLSKEQTIVIQNFSALKKFDEKQSFATWYQTFDSYCKVNRIPEDLLKDHLLLNVEGRVAKIVAEAKEYTTFNNLIEFLKDKFTGKCSILEAELNIEKIKNMPLNKSNIDQISALIDQNIRTLYNTLDEERIFFENKNLLRQLLPNEIKLLMRNETTKDWSYYVASVKECMELSSMIKRNNTQSSKYDKKKDIKCNRCNYRGHIEKECKSKTKWDPNSKTRINLLNKEKDDSSNILHKEILINGKIKAKAALDTCSEISILSNKLAKQLSISKTRDKIIIEGIENKTIGNWGDRSISIKIDDEEIKLDKILIKDLPKETQCDILLGLDALSKYNKYIDLKKKKILNIEEIIKEYEEKIKLPSYKSYCTIIKDTFKESWLKNLNNLEEAEKNFQEKYDLKMDRYNPSLMSGRQEYNYNKELKKFKFYKVPQNLLPMANQIIETYLKNNMIQVEKHPDFVHPILLLRKPTIQGINKEKLENNYRMVCDLRLINSITIRQSGANLNTVEEFKRIKGGENILYSLIDLSNAYQQILIPEEMRSKYSFSADGINIYSYKTLPQGATNSAFQFSLVTSELLKKYKNDGQVIQHIDDFLVITSLPKEKSEVEAIRKHAEVLNEILEIFQKNNLYFNIYKSKLFRKELNYLAYTLNQKGYTPSLKSISNLIKQIPKTKKELQRFLFGTQYFKQTLPTFTVNAERLFAKLGKKKTSFYMDEEDKKNYLNIVNELLSSPTLGYPRNNWKFILKTDASDLAIGASLIQVNPNDEKDKILIGLVSEKLKRTQRKRHSSYLEMKAICIALNRFSYLLKGNEITIETDHKPIQYIQNNSMNDRYMELINFINCYPATIIIKYIKGKDNKFPDYLSRLIDHAIENEEKKVYETENKIIFSPNYLERDEKEIQINKINLNTILERNDKSKLLSKRKGEKIGKNQKNVEKSIRSNIKRRGRPKGSLKRKPGRPKGSLKKKPGRPKRSQKERKVQEEIKENLDKIINSLEEYSIEEIIKHQKQDKEITQEFIQNNKLQKLNNCLGKVDEEYPLKFRPYVPEAIIPKLVELVHEKGHFGYIKMLRNLNMRYFSKNFSKYVKAYTENCETCLLRNNYPKIKYERTLNVAYPNQIWSCDLSGKFQFNGEEKVILICVDTFSKFIMAKEIEGDPTDKKIIKAISEFIYLYSKPTIIVVDNAKYLNSNEAKRFFEISQIKLISVAPYTHGNRIAELYLKLIEETFSKIRQEKNEEIKFKDLLGMATYFLNKGTQSNNFNAFEIFMFKENNLRNIENINLENYNYDISKYVIPMMHKQEELYAAVYTTDLYRKLSKKNQIFKSNEFKVGDYFILKKQNSDKWDKANEKFKVLATDSLHCYFRNNDPKSRKLYKVNWTDIRKAPKSV